MVRRARSEGNRAETTRMRAWWLLPLLLLTGLAVRAATFEEGFDAYQSGEHQRAREIWERAAANGDSRSMFSLGSLYMRGTGVAQSAEDAYAWFLRAAEVGLPQAQYNVAFMLEQGNGVDSDPASALRWYEKAAKAGLPQAQAAYASRLWDGRGTEADPVLAARFFESAARQGHPEAQNSLGTMLENGIGVAPDPGQAALWYERAALQGVRDAQASLSRLYREGRGITANGERADYWAARARGEREEEPPPGTMVAVAPRQEPAAPRAEERKAPAPAVTARAEPAAPKPAEPARAAPGKTADAASASAAEAPRERVATAPRQAASTVRLDATPPPAEAPREPQTWFDAAPAGHYTAQLIGSSNPDALERFVSRHGLGDRAALVETRRDGKSWFLVVYGDFASRGDANRALARLPEAARKHGAWVRTVGEVRKLRVGG